MIRTRHINILVLSLSVYASVAAARPCEMVRAGSLYSTATAAAGSLGNVAAASALECLAPDRHWQQVRTDDGRIGWVRRHQVRMLTQPIAEDQDDGLRQRLANLARLITGLFQGISQPPRSGGGTITATIGIRGLDSQQAAASVADLAQLQRLDQIASDADSARRFAVAGGLRARSIESGP